MVSVPSPLLPLRVVMLFPFQSLRIHCHHPKLPWPPPSSPSSVLSLPLSAAACHKMPKTPKVPVSASASASSASDGLVALEKRVAAVEQQQKQDKIFSLMKQKKQLLNSEMKSYSDNFTVKGLKYAMKDVQGDDEKEERFRERVLRVFVDQGLLSAKHVFVGGNGPDKGRILRGVLRHAHPVGTKDNATIVVAFLESWFVSKINSKLNGGKKLKDGIRIVPHMPPILDALRNEALKVRKAMLAADSSKKIIMKKMLRKPWIALAEVRNGRKVDIDFRVEDGRLVNPTLTLAKLELEGKEQFTPKMFLSLDEHAKFPPGIVKAKRTAEDHLDDDDDDDDDDNAGMDLDA